jgi:hypothetical protein
MATRLGLDRPQTALSRERCRGRAGVLMSGSFSHPATASPAAWRSSPAYSIAARLSGADRDGSLAAFLKPDLTPPERTVAQVEGWILGVA